MHWEEVNKKMKTRMESLRVGASMYINGVAFSVTQKRRKRLVLEAYGLEEEVKATIRAAQIAKEAEEALNAKSED